MFKKKEENESRERLNTKFWMKRRDRWRRASVTELTVSSSVGLARSHRK